MMKLLNILIILDLFFFPLFEVVTASSSSHSNVELSGIHQVADENPFLRGPTVNMVTNDFLM